MSKSEILLKIHIYQKPKILFITWFFTDQSRLYYNEICTIFRICSFIVGTFKTECLYRCKPASDEQVKALVDEYVHFYNFERIDLKNGLTPDEIRRKAA